MADFGDPIFVRGESSIFEMTLTPDVLKRIRRGELTPVDAAREKFHRPLDNDKTVRTRLVQTGPFTGTLPDATPTTNPTATAADEVVASETVPEVLAWVDAADGAERVARARQALADEQAKDHPRSTLIHPLTEIVSAATEG